MTDREVNSTPEAEKRDEDVWTQGPEQPAPPSAGTAQSASPTQSEQQWERELIARVTFAAISEQRKSRRWGIFFKSLGFIYVGIILLMYVPSREATLSVGKKHTALVEVNGVIADDAEANADAIVTGLRAAFKDTNTAGVILRINSPGGSPVQAGYVNDEINRLKEEYPDTPVYAVISDICASGGYYIAAAADKIYADKASLVGSIGVLMNGFGFVDSIEKLGVERRLLTAGDNKGFLDPFIPLNAEHVDHMKTILETTHQQFIDVVKRGRGDRLKDEPALFSGLIWTGEQGLELGLVDGLGSSSYVAREVVGEELIVNYTRKPNPLERFAERFGASAGVAVTRALGMDSVQLR